MKNQTNSVSLKRFQFLAAGFLIFASICGSVHIFAASEDPNFCGKNGEDLDSEEVDCVEPAAIALPYPVMLPAAVELYDVKTPCSITSTPEPGLRKVENEQMFRGFSEPEAATCHQDTPHVEEKRFRRVNSAIELRQWRTLAADDSSVERKLVERTLRRLFKPGAFSIRIAENPEELFTHFTTLHQELLTNCINCVNESIGDEPVAHVIYLDNSMGQSEIGDGAALAFEIRKYESAHKIKVKSPIVIRSSDGAKTLLARYGSFFLTPQERQDLSTEQQWDILWNVHRITPNFKPSLPAQVLATLRRIEAINQLTGCLNTKVLAASSGSFSASSSPLTHSTK